MPNEFWPQGSKIFGWFSVVPLLFFASDLDSEVFPWKWGVLWGLGFTAFHYFWLSRFGQFSLWTLGGVGLVYSAYGSLFIPLLSYTLKTTPRSYHPVVAALVITTFDYLRSIGYLGFPWNLVAHPFYQSLSFIQIVDIGGVFLLGFLIVYIQGLVYVGLSRNRIPWAAGLSGTFFLVVFFAYGNVRLNDYPISKDGDTIVDILMVQQNEDSWSSGAGPEGLRRLQNLTLEGLQRQPLNLSTIDFETRPFSLDLALWSETSLAYTPESLVRAQDRFPEGFPFRDFLRDLGSPLLTGAPVLVDPDNPREGLMNGAVLLTESEGVVVIGDTYGKNRLIPFAEHVPLDSIPFLSRFLEEQIGISASGWKHGPDFLPLTVNLASKAIVVGVPICFEDSFFQHVRLLTLEGSQLFINLTNNSWSHTSTAHGQHTAAAVFRTIETRRTMIRSTNSGHTSVIGPQGAILFQAPEFTTLSLPLRVPLNTIDPEFTWYTCLGDWFPAGVLFALFLLTLWTSARTRENKNDHRLGWPFDSFQEYW